jgi:hypothetical protein
MDLVGAHIHSDSWGPPGYDIPFDWGMNDIVYAHPDKLFVFAADNTGPSPVTLGSPASAKNVMSGGALDVLQVSGLDRNASWISLALIPASERDRQPTLVMAAGERYGWSRDPFEGGRGLQAIASRVFDVDPGAAGFFVFVIETVEELEFLTQFDPPPAAAVTDRMLDYGDSVNFPVFLVLNEFFCELIDDTLTFTLTLQPAFAPDQGTPASVASYSSRGPSHQGLMKPEVVAPGTSIVSARSDPSGASAQIPPITLKQGTSMATPNVAGALALVEQYFRDGLYKGVSLVPSSALFRALAVTAADPLAVGDKTINCDSGFGQINLRPHLPFPGDPFRIHLADAIEIGDAPHLVSEFAVSNTSEELRVTIAYLDPPTSTDRWAPLFHDLDLILVSPSNRTFRGNRRPDGTEERFSTIERVIVDPDELELGTYEIHVIDLKPDWGSPVNFSIVAVGGIDIDSTFLSFQPADSCLPTCGAGECNSETLICSCPVGALGQSCQTPVDSLPAEGLARNFELPPFGHNWIEIGNDRKGAVSGTLTIRTANGRLFRVFSAPGNARDQTGDYELTGNSTAQLRFPIDLTDPGVGVTFWLRNEAEVPQNFSLQVDIPAANESKGLAVGVIAAIAAGGVVLVAGIVVFVVCWRSRRATQAKYGERLSGAADGFTNP